MNPYRLSGAGDGRERNASMTAAVKRLAPVMAGQGPSLVAAFVATLVASSSALLGPYLIGRTVDISIRGGDYAGVLRSAGLLLVAYLAGLVATYVQTQRMGLVGDRRAHV